MSYPYSRYGSAAAQEAAAAAAASAQDVSSALSDVAVGVSDITGLLSAPTDRAGVVVDFYYPSAGAFLAATYRYDGDASKALHDGGRYISNTVPWGGSRSGVADFRSGAGESDPGGSGVWVLSTDRPTSDNYGILTGDDIGPTLAVCEYLRITVDVVCSKTESANKMTLIQDRGVTIKPAGSGFSDREFVITSSGDESYFEIHSFDMDNMFLGGLAVTGDGSRVERFEGRNMVQPEGTGEYSSFVEITGANCSAGYVYAENFNKGSHEPNSGLRALSVSRSAEGFRFDTIKAYNGNGPFVLDAPGCVGGTIDCELINGNGIYVLDFDGDFFLDKLISKDNEDELAVVKSTGTTHISTVEAVNSKSFGLEGAGRVIIGKMSVINTSASDLYSGQVIRTRDAGGASAPNDTLHIGELYVESAAEREAPCLWSVNNNTIRDFSIGKLTARFTNRNESFTRLGYWNQSSPVEFFTIGSLDVIVNDEVGSGNNNSFLSFDIPQVTISGFIGVDRFLRNQGLINIRLNYSSQNTITITGAPVIRTSAAGYVQGQHITQNGERRPMDFTGDGTVPVAGRYVRGDRIWNSYASASSSPGLVCTLGGDSPLFAEMPDVGQNES